MDESQNAPLLILIEKYVKEEITEAQFREEIEKLLKKRIMGVKNE